MSDTRAEEMVPLRPTNLASERNRAGTILTRFWAELIVMALASALWMPRLSGPIDLRWDAGVYYLLGTSLATGQGYRILSEPGAPEALQYPPLLPAIVALHERALGSTDPAIVAPWLRISYAALFLVYAQAALALARRYLSPIFAVMAVALCLLQVNTIFLSDLLFAELPFALVSVVFALVATSGSSALRSWPREAASFALAATGFLLRTAGLALLGAWVVEALFRRRWWLAVARGLLALGPVLLWQAHVVRVRGSYEYAHPAYEYQRAPYQYYNVSYAENLHLIDPFRPELGPVSAGAITARVVTNLPSMMVAVGETVSTRTAYWRQLLGRAEQRLFRRMVIPESIVFVPVLILATLVLFGLILLVRRGAWLMVLIVIGSLGLTCTTPWPAQFDRYLAGLAPFFAICAFLSLSEIHAALPRLRFRFESIAARTVVAGLVTLAFGSQIFAAVKLFQQRRREAARASALVPDRKSSPMFYHDPTWEVWEKTAAWVRMHAGPDAIVATSAPHFFYLRTGLRAILPPMEANLEEERRLLEAVPVSYIIIDELIFLDVSRRYALPAIASDPRHWRLVHVIDGTKTYARVGAAE